MEPIGVVFDIKQMAVFDGPGLRTTVFLKGCPLRCQWCHNPEGLEAFPQLMVSENGCLHCNACKRVCQHKDACVQCGACVDACPLHLRRMAGTVYTAGALSQKLLRSENILRTNGGVTFSGGEPLMQADFVATVCEQLHGLHTCVETSGFGTDEQFANVLAHMDYVLMDIKLMDPILHKHYTGCDNAPILRHYATLRQSGILHTIRIPLIPGVTDTPENLQATAVLLRGDPTLERVELLPYHQTAGAKYGMVGKTYAPTFSEAAAPNADTDIFTTQGIPCRVL